MANQKYIKVTLKGETKSHIVLATLKNFYISQGAKIEHPTDEEVYAAVPQDRPVGATARPANPRPARTDEEKALRHAVDTLDRDNKEKQEEIRRLEKEVQQLNEDSEKLAQDKEEYAKTIEELRGKLAAAETTISESESVIEALRKELVEATAKTQKKAKADAEPENAAAAEA